MRVLSVVERGWFGARQCSLALDAMAIPVTHLIKGYLAPEIRAMIRTYPHIHIVSVPRLLFRAWLWTIMLWQTATGRLRWILIDHERTLKEVGWWCRVFRVTPVVIQQTAQGYELSVDGQDTSFSSLFQA